MEIKGEIEMGILKSQLGIQSYCFRGFKENAVVAEKIKACGASAIELCGVHADFLSEESCDAALATYKAAGVEIVSIGVQGLCGNDAAERPFFEFVKKAGAKFMSVNFSPKITADEFRKIEAMADEYDVNLGIHNHGGYHWLGSSEILRHIFSITSPRIGLTLDTAWAMDAGENPVKMIKEFGTRLHGLHLKDFIFDTARRPEDVVVGTGNLKLDEIATALQEVNFAGFAVIEYEGDVENPVPALTKCVTNIKAAF